MKNWTAQEAEEKIQLTLCPADGLHEDVVLVDFLLVMLELPFQALQLLTGELTRVLCLLEVCDGEELVSKWSE